MFKILTEKLQSIPATIISGTFLLFYLILPFFNINLMFNFCIISIIISGLPLLINAIKKLIFNKGIRKLSSALLISIAMIASILIGDLFAAGEIAFIMSIGEILEEITTDKAKRGLSKLINLTPQSARRIINGKEEIILADKIRENDIIRILPGETIAVDGIIIEGETTVDQSVMTGESIPIDKTISDNVLGGTINCFGTIDIKVTNIAQNSSLQKLIKMVQDAENKKSPIQRIADKWASVLVPTALLISIICFLITQDIVRSVTILVVFCPCALVLATPTAIMAGIGQATKHGIIIKSGEALEKMGKIDTIAFDKTGTLTYGKLEVSNYLSFCDIPKEKILQIVASIEAKSEHLIGKAIVEYSKTNNYELFNTTDFKMFLGKGIYSKINNDEYFCGNEKYLIENNIFIDDKIKSTIEKYSLEGKAIILIANKNKCLGLITLSDSLRESSSETIKQLSKINIESILLTGDNTNSATYFGNKIGINKIFSNLLPDEKVKIIKTLQNNNKNVCMIGDGVNDAPALKTANVGISMGAIGSDITVESSDIALMNEDISKIVYLKLLSSKTVKTIKIGILLSMLINFLGITLSIFGLLNPTIGALIHNAGSIFVIMFSAFLYEKKIKY